MARTKVFKRPWICRHGHPMWRKPVSGHWICHTCNDMNLNATGKKFDVCIHGHKRIVGTNCRVCAGYSLTSWLKELDATGEAHCMNGHPVSHNDNSIVYIKTKKFKARHCRQCDTNSIAVARQSTPDVTVNPMCRKGLHERTEENTHYINGKRQCKPCWSTAQQAYDDRLALKRQKKADLRPSYVDWVVVERMLVKGQMDYIRRGRHVGPTDGERWVAYCTFVQQAGGRHPDELYGEPGYDVMQLWKYSAWKGLGTKYRWRKLTVGEVRAAIADPEYVSGGLLLKYKER